MGIAPLNRSLIGSTGELVTVPDDVIGVDFTGVGASLGDRVTWGNTGPRGNIGPVGDIGTGIDGSKVISVENRDFLGPTVLL